MSILDISKLKFNWKGVFSPAKTYKAQDIVYYDGTTYTAIKQVQGVLPTTLGVNWKLTTQGVTENNKIFASKLASASKNSSVYAIPSRRVAKLFKGYGSAGFGKTSFLMLNGEVKSTGVATNNANGSDTQMNLPNSIAFRDYNNSVRIVQGYDGALENFALDVDGNVWAWGNNANGQLGLGDTTNRLVAEKITYFADRGIKIAKVIINDCSIYAGNVFGRATYFITTSGLLYGVGNNANGGLGNGTTNATSTPIPISELSNVVDVWVSAVGTAYALTDEGKLYGWGWNGKGQLGLGDTANQLTPVLIMEDVVQASTNYSQDTANGGDYSYMLVLKTDGTIWASGFNGYGQLGLGHTINILSFVKVQFPAGEVLCKSINTQDGAWGISTAIDVNNNLWIWGYNGYGQLGNGTSTNLSVPFKPNGAFQGKVSSVKIVGFKSYTTVFVYSKSANSIWASGYNGASQLANGVTSTSTTPSFVELAGINGTIEDFELRTNDGMKGSGYILYTDGRVSAWGSNEFGQLGTNHSTGLQSALAEVLL